MLDFAYGQSSFPPEASRHGDTVKVNYFLGLYRVADKYDFPNLRLLFACWFKKYMHAWLHRFDKPHEKDSSAYQEFGGFVKDIYDLVGSKHQPSHPLVKTLLEVADNQGSASILNNSGFNQPLVIVASREIAEYGRDIFLRLMKKTGSSGPDEQGKVVKTELCVGINVRCLRCNMEWWRVTLRGKQDIGMRCPGCKGLMEDFDGE
jgi:hypothetical protein